ncbi:hypothetical protein [Halomonas sp.]|uniref:hypothetical protein n=1 Tax=Halomonas sp. TaxID=1486246 RepID=UPI003D0A9F50
MNDGRSAHTHIALLKLDPQRQPEPCYVKFYPDRLAPDSDDVHRGLVNEIVGHVVGAELGACVPDCAGLIVLPPSRLASRPQWVANSDDAPLVGWWSKDMAHPSLKAHYHIPDYPTAKELAALKKAFEELAASPEIHRAIALDNLLANVDRNIGNLLRKARGRYVLIDHGKCLTGDGWRVENLDPAAEYRNVLDRIARQVSPTGELNSATLKEHDAMVERLDGALDTLWPWMLKAIEREEAEAVEEFIRQRGHPGRYAQRMGLLT